MKRHAVLICSKCLTPAILVQTPGMLFPMYCCHCNTCDNQSMIAFFDNEQFNEDVSNSKNFEFTYLTKFESAYLINFNHWITGPRVTWEVLG